MKRSVSLYVTSGTSKKGSTYYALVLDLGWVRRFLTFEVGIICYVLDCEIEDLPSLIASKNNKIPVTFK